MQMILLNANVRNTDNGNSPHNSHKSIRVDLSHQSHTYNDLHAIIQNAINLIGSNGSLEIVNASISEQEKNNLISMIKNQNIKLKFIEEIENASFNSQGVLTIDNKKRSQKSLSLSSIDKIKRIEIRNLYSTNIITFLAKKLKFDSGATIVIEDSIIQIDEWKELCMALVKAHIKSIMLKDCNAKGTNRPADIDDIRQRYLPGINFELSSTRSHNVRHNQELNIPGISNQIYNMQNGNGGNQQKEGGPIALRQTPEGRIQALNIIRKKTDSITQVMIDKFLANYKQPVKNSGMPQQNNHGSEVDGYKLSILSKLPLNNSSLTWMFKGLETTKTMQVFREAYRSTCNQIFNKINPCTPNTIVNKLLDIQEQILLGASSVVKITKPLLHGTPGNGKTTSLKTQGWFILLRDLIAYHMQQHIRKSYTKQEAAEFEAKLLQVIEQAKKEIFTLISLGYREAKDPNLFIYHYIALVPCQNIGDIMEINGNNTTYVGANCGKFMHIYTGLNSNYSKLHSIVTNNGSAFKLSSEMIGNNEYVASSRVIIFDEMDKFASRNGDSTQVINTLTDLIGEGTLQHTYLDAKLSFQGSIIAGAANNIDRVPPHLKDRTIIIPAATYNNEARAKIFQQRLNDTLASYNYSIVNNEIIVKDSNLQNKLIIEPAVISALSTANASDNGSLRRLISNVDTLSEAIIREGILQEEEQVTFTSEMLQKICPELSISASLDIEHDQEDTVLVPYTVNDELKLIPIKIYVHRSDQSNGNEICLQNSFAAAKDTQKEFSAPQFISNLVRAAADATSQTLSREDILPAGMANTSDPIMRKLVLLKSIMSELLTTTIRRTVVSIGTTGSQYLLSDISHVALTILLLLIGRKIGTKRIPLNTLIVGGCDIKGDVTLDADRDNNISSKVAILLGTAQKQQIVNVLLPTKRMSDLRSYVIRNNLNTKDIVMYSSNNVYEAAMILHCLYILDDAENMKDSVQSATTYLNTKRVNPVK